LARSVQDLERAVADAQQRFVDAVDAIESGQFPPRPAHVRLCASCPYTTICRKEYVVDPHEPDAATAV
jgi:CRISPR/Cas system-associated exonuclease Cas4 (RecB family)